MTEEILCTKCYELIDISDKLDCYTDYKQEETFEVIECPHCHTQNAIYFTLDVNFSSREADEEDISSFTNNTFGL